MFDDQLPPPAPGLNPSAAPPVDRRALYLRWRPSRFEDVVGQEHVTRTLRNAVKLGRPSHAYLFTGPRGTGKTSVARILYRAVNCESTVDGDPCNACPLCKGALDGRAMDLVEIDAASNRGIDDIRDLRDKVAFRPGEGRYRVYIVDEAHELTPAAWDAFLKTLEEPPPHAIFVLATTEAHKVPATIVSRCQRFDFRRIPFQATRDQLAHIAVAEGWQIEPAVLERLALVARGGLRDAESLLDQLVAFAGDRVDMAVARAALSLPSIEALQAAIDGMTRRDAPAVMAVMSDAAEGGADLRLFAEELIVHLRALLLLRVGADTRLSDELPEAEVAWLRERAPAWNTGALMQLVQTLSEALARTRDAQQFQVQTEVALLVACDAESQSPPATLRAPALGAAVSAPGVTSARAAPKIPRPGRAVEDPAAASAPTASAPPTVAAAGAPDLDPAVAPAGAPSLEVAFAGWPEPEPEPEPPVAAEVGEVVTPIGGALPPGATLKTRWPDVIDHVKRRNQILGSLLGSAHPVSVEDNLLIVAFGTDFNRKSAEKASNRQIIEMAFERVYGTAYRLRCTVGTDSATGPALLEDPVINYAARTFGGQPKRLPSD